MNTLAVFKQSPKIIPFVKPKLEFKKDGTIDKRYGKKDIKKVGASAMSCLYTREEIVNVYNTYKKYITEAICNSKSDKPTYKEKVARRNLCMFVCSINISFRGGDFCKLKYSDIFDCNWNFHIESKYMTQKSHKYVDMYFNKDFKSAILEYKNWLQKIDEIKLDDYIFTSCKGSHVGRHRWWEINSNMCREAGITRKIGTHGNRGTYAYHFIEVAEDKSEAMEDLRDALGHVDVRVTRKYAHRLRESVNENVEKMAFIYP